MRRVFRLPVNRARLAHDVDEELAFHLETRVQQLVARGLSPDAARPEAGTSSATSVGSAVIHDGRTTGSNRCDARTSLSDA
jgi:hypothetical protein